MKDKAGETYIKIDEDILKDVPQEEWKSTVKQAIKERFPNGFKRNGWTIENTKESRKEFVWSKYTKALQWEGANAYADKMRIAANLDEIIGRQTKYTVSLRTTRMRKHSTGEKSRSKSRRTPMRRMC